jgi:hypothetical protein
MMPYNLPPKKCLKEPLVSAAHQEAPEESEVRASQHEAPEAQHEAGDQPPITYMLDQF